MIFVIFITKRHLFSIKNRRVDIFGVTYHFDLYIVHPKSIHLADIILCVPKVA